MSVQPWRVIEWVWCPCGVRAAHAAHGLCHVCAGVLRLHELGWDEEQPETHSDPK